MERTFTCRLATESDLLAILELNHHLHESEEILSADQRISTIWKSILDDSRLFCFVAEISGKVRATCLLDIVPNLTRGARPFGVLQNVVTHRDFRGQGLGSTLNKFALEFAWTRDCYQVLVQTGRPKVISFYERLGFRQDKVGLVAKPAAN